MNDQQLLRQFVRDGSQPAFAELVRRHVNVVYAAALRQVRQPHLAEDVTQAVFIVLHRKAEKLGNMPTIGGWLLKVTRYAAVDAMRKQARQHRHEQAAARPEAVTGAATPDWGLVAPVLDEAMGRLNDGDRDAVVMRYFEDATFPEVGQRLGISEEAARKRVGRAVLKLRGLLAGRGVTLSVGALTTMMATHAATAAPPHLAACAASISAGTVGAASLSIASGTIAMIGLAKTKLALAMAAGILLVVGATVLVVIGPLASTRAKPASAAAQPAAAMLAPPPQALLGHWHSYVDETSSNPQPPRMHLIIDPDQITVREQITGNTEQGIILRYEVNNRDQPPSLTVVNESENVEWSGHYEFLDSDLLQISLQALPLPGQPRATGQPTDFLSIILHRGETGTPGYVCKSATEHLTDAAAESMKQNRPSDD